LPFPVQRAGLLSSINEAQYKPIPNECKNLSAEEMELARNNPLAALFLPRQENGIRPACALPYELAVDGALSEDRKSFIIQFAAGRQLFGENAAGAPFHVYSPKMVRPAGPHSEIWEAGRAWSYAISAGDLISDNWALHDFQTGEYFLRVHGPNGFFREFRGASNDPRLRVALFPMPSHNPAAYEATLQLTNRDPARPITIVVGDATYGHPERMANLASAGDIGAQANLKLDLGQTFGWHDLRIRVQGAPNFEQRYAGRIETGNESFSDPCMGRTLG
jgi:phospholipase C